MLAIDRYNEIVATLYKSNPKLFMYSPVFCRCEGQSYLYPRWSNNQEIEKPNYFSDIIRFFAKIIRDLAFSIIAPRKQLSPEPGKAIFVFSYFDKRNDNNGILREEYFRGVMEGTPDLHCFYKLINPGYYQRGAYYLRLLEKLKKNFHACAEYSFITPLMMVKAVSLTVQHLFKFIKHKFPVVEDEELFSAVKSAHMKEIIDGTIYQGYIQKLLFEKLLAHQPREIHSVWENQPWQRILESVKKNISPSTVSKGFQHTGFSKKLLQHYPASIEGDLDTYPDYVISNGYINCEELKNNTPIPSNIIVGGALRQDVMLARGLEVIADLIPGQAIEIAFAFSWDQSTYEQIVRDLESLPKNITVHLKFHPIYPDWLNKQDLPDGFINSRASWSEIAETCALVLVNDNSLMFEGYYYGMHTVVYDGVNLEGLETRDFMSPISHLGRPDLALILKEETIHQINASTREVLASGYLDRYFVNRGRAELKQIFFDT